MEHIWLVLDLDDQFNVKAFADPYDARQWLNDHGYYEKRPGIYMDQHARYAAIKEVILHGKHRQDL